MALLPSFEIGPIRPPSEARSLLLRVNRNCPWNRCSFCSIYKGTDFSPRTVDDVLVDIEATRALADRVHEIAHRSGHDGRLTAEVVYALPLEGASPEMMHVADWLLAGATSVFLQDANALLMPTAELVRVLQALRRTFPSIERVTTYARAHTLTRRSVAELGALREAGLDRVHVGLESGCDAVLELMEKGVSAERQIDAGRRVKEAGLELSLYVMPGLGGRRYSRAHALDTARALSAIDADYIRIRSLVVPPRTPLSEQVETGRFEPLGAVEILSELRLMLEHVDGVHSTVVSDHILNLLEEVEGRLPRDKEKMLAKIDAFLALPPDRQELFQVGRWVGAFRRLTDMNDGPHEMKVRAMMEKLRAAYGSVDRGMYELVKRFI